MDCLPQWGSKVIIYRLPLLHLASEALYSQPTLELEWEDRKPAGVIETLHSR